MPITHQQTNSQANIVPLIRETHEMSQLLKGFCLLVHVFFLFGLFIYFQVNLFFGLSILFVIFCFVFFLCSQSEMFNANRLSCCCCGCEDDDAQFHTSARFYYSTNNSNGLLLLLTNKK